MADEERGDQTATERLYVPAGHFYSPIVKRSEAEQHLLALRERPIPASIPNIPMERSEMVGLWGRLLPFLTTNPFPDVVTPPFRYAFENPSYSWGDASVLHSMIRLYRPRRMIEIGCGWSSACTLDTVENYLNGECQLTFIDPHPALAQGLIGKTSVPVTVLGVEVQKVPLDTFDVLQSGDILFIDSTHVLRTGSDVCMELFEILPRLSAGVLVHFHDMFWPFEYPWPWVIDENRSWNELYAVRAFLSDNKAWRVLFFNDYFAKLERRLIEETYPRLLRNSGGALWLQRL